MKKFREIIEEYRTKAFSERDKGNRFEKINAGLYENLPGLSWTIYRGLVME